MSDERAIDEVLERAASLHSQGLLNEAQDLLRDAQLKSTDPVSLTRIASMTIDVGALRDAEMALTTALELDSGFGPAHFYLGLTYRAQGRMDAALISLQRALCYDESSVTLTVLGVVELELGLDSKAEQSFRRAISLDPQNEEALYNLATLVGKDRTQEAVTLFEKALEIDPDYELAHRELGWLQRQIDCFPEAEYHLRRAIELDISDGWAYIYLANLLWATGDLGSAKDFFRKAVVVWPDRSVPYWCLGHFLEAQGKDEEAATFFARAVSIDPGDAQAHWRYGSHLAKRGEAQKAASYLRWALELNPNDKRVIAALASLGVS